MRSNQADGRASPRPWRRRSHEERRTATKARILEATAQCLFELGYAGTTTIEIAKRAGLSRGALQHFENKSELLVSAVEYLTEQSFDAYTSGLEKAAGDDDKISASIDLSWANVQSPTFYAWLELVVAARTDPELSEALRAMGERFEARLQQIHQATFAPREGWEVEFPTFPFLNLALMQGFALGLLASGREGSPLYRDAWVRMARTVMVPRRTADDSGRGT